MDLTGEPLAEMKKVPFLFEETTLSKAGVTLDGIGTINGKEAYVIKMVKQICTTK
jgi:hypothetical protein